MTEEFRSPGFDERGMPGASPGASPGVGSGGVLSVLAPEEEDTPEGGAATTGAPQRDGEAGSREVELHPSGVPSAPRASRRASGLARRVGAWLEDRDWLVHVAAFIQLHEEAQDRLWGMAAVAASVNVKWGAGSIRSFAGEVGYSARRIYEFVETYRAFTDPETDEPLGRLPTQTFENHHIAATLARHGEDPAEALVVADENQYSSREFREYAAERARILAAEATGRTVTRTSAEMCPECGSERVLPPGVEPREYRSHADLRDENERLKARVAELEAEVERLEAAAGEEMEYDYSASENLSRVTNTSTRSR